MKCCKATSGLQELMNQHNKFFYKYQCTSKLNSKYLFLLQSDAKIHTDNPIQRKQTMKMQD